MGVKSSRKLEWGQGEHRCCGAPSFPGVNSLWIWTAPLCMAWDMGSHACSDKEGTILGTRVHKPSILITVRFIIVLQGLWRESWGFYSPGNQLQPPEQCCPFCGWSANPRWLSLFLHLRWELPRPIWKPKSSQGTNSVWFFQGKFIPCGKWLHTDGIFVHCREKWSLPLGCVAVVSGRRYF